MKPLKYNLVNLFERSCVHLSILAITLLSISVLADDNKILIQSTTSTANSGLYKYLLPLFEAETGVKANVVAVGTGQAIRNARNCDADVLLVHAKSAEEAFVADGFGVGRFDVMYNDFIVIGPADDPANVKATKTAKHALMNIADNQSLFASRGDDSGTHKKEQILWSTTKVDVESEEAEAWYRSTGSGMGATINTAIGLDAYTMTDRATWISFKNKNEHQIVLEGDPILFNQYGVILVNPEKCPSVARDSATLFIDWLLSQETQQAIANFKIDGQQLFYPNAN